MLCWMDDCETIAHRITTMLVRCQPLLLLLVLSSALQLEETLHHEPPAPAPDDPEEEPPNLLFIVVDQLRFDALGHVQQSMSEYAGKTKVLTPNLDKLARQGVRFDTAYCQLPSCGPARTALYTGTTIERSGVQSNKLLRTKVAAANPELFQDKIMQLESFEQILVEHYGYVAENYGKWHLPERCAWLSDPTKGRVIRYNDYDVLTHRPKFNTNFLWRNMYARINRQMTFKDRLRPTLKSGQAKNTWDGWPYQPLKLNSKKTVMGWSDLPFKYSSTACQARLAWQALERLSRGNMPFSLVLNISSPHDPMTPSSLFRRYYRSRMKSNYVSPSIVDDHSNSPYKSEPRVRNQPNAIKEMTAVYYALVQEIDVWIGRLLHRLQSLDLNENTLVVFTSDHGELLGAHGQLGKGNLYEEAVRVPLFMRLPGRIPKGRVVQTPVSHLDVFSTVLDYLNASEHDHSDGTSLRRYIEGSADNEWYDNHVVVVERDERYPSRNGSMLSGELGRSPNFMVRHGHYKLIMTKLRHSPTLDMLFDLAKDPHEMNNLVGRKGKRAGLSVIGKAEHLKCLLKWNG